ncbi:MAG: hypothetical protein IJU79_07130 [Desulfovibrionaceae bacterium]|nr:hypothetical protein [Desulfovibrionaceae bacterium]
MQAFTFTTQIHVENARYARTYPFVDSQSQATSFEKCIIQMPREDSQILDVLKARFGDQYLRYLKLVKEEAIAANPNLPMRLGRLYGPKLVLQEEAECLSAQLQFLRAQKPHKEHFRFALVNGHGANFGDSLIGTTAFQCVAQILKAHCPNFSVDVLFGPMHRPELRTIVGNLPYIDRVLFRTLTLAEFAVYDGYFDTSPLPKLPKFNTMPNVDWYLWWYGLDPNKIQLSSKRNQLWLKERALNDVRSQLAKISGKTLLFAPQASTTLRSFPLSSAKKFVQRCLELDPELIVLTTQDVGLQQNRCISLQGKIGDTWHFMALVAQAKRCISVDSFAPHLCDAAAIPCVTLTSAIPKEFYPYYPTVQMLEIPHMRDLPGFKQSILDDAAWAKTKDAYVESWDELDAGKVLDILYALEAQPKSVSHVSIVHEDHAGSYFTNADIRQGFAYQRVHPFYKAILPLLDSLCQRYLPFGGTCVVSMPATVDIMLAFLEQWRIRGAELHIFEPRAMQARLLDALALQAGLEQKLGIPKMPLQSPPITVAGFDPWSESLAGTYGNCLFKPTQLACASIDSFQFSACHVLLLQPPTPMAQTLAGAIETIKRHHPLIMILPTIDDCLKSLRDLTPLGYDLKQVLADGMQGMLAVPKK